MPTLEGSIQWAIDHSRESATYVREVYNPATGGWHEQEVFDPVIFATHLCGGLLGLIVGVHSSGDIDTTMEAVDAAARLYEATIAPVSKAVLEGNPPEPQPTGPVPTTNAGRMTQAEVDELLREHQEDQ